MPWSLYLDRNVGHVPRQMLFLMRPWHLYIYTSPFALKASGFRGYIIEGETVVRSKTFVHYKISPSVKHVVQDNFENYLFFFSIQGMYVHINRVLSAASQLIDNGHYASEVIRSHMLRIDREWRAFAVALDERSQLLAMSVTFHKKVYEVSIQQRWCLKKGWVKVEIVYELSYFLSVSFKRMALQIPLFFKLWWEMVEKVWPNFHTTCVCVIHTNILYAVQMTFSKISQIFLILMIPNPHNICKFSW